MDFYKGLSGKFIVSYVLTAFFGICTFISISNINKLERSRDIVQSIHLKLLNMRNQEKDFIAREFRDTVFLGTGVSEYRSLFRKEAFQIDSLVKELHKQEILSKQGKDSIIFLMEAYINVFNELSELLRKKGFKDWGLIGELRERIHAVEDDPTIYDRSFLLMLRKHEKDFLLRNDPKYVVKFVDAIEDFLGHISLRVWEVSKKEELILKITEYRKIFLEVSAITESIGFNESLGSKGELESVALNLTTLLDRISMHSITTIERKLTLNLITLIVLLVVIFLVGAFILAIHVRKITRNINLINENTSELALGRLPKLRKVNSTDELGKAHEAINKLIEGHSAKATFATKIGDGKLNVDLKILSSQDVLGLSLLEMRDSLKQVINDTNDVIRKAGEEGDLRAWIDLKDKKGAWKHLSEGIK